MLVLSSCVKDKVSSLPPCHLHLGDAQENGSTLCKTAAENQPAEQNTLRTTDTPRMPVGLPGDENEGKGSRQYKGLELVHQQIKALLIKRFHHASRSYKDFLAQVSDDFCFLTLSTFSALSLLGSVWGKQDLSA